MINISVHFSIFTKLTHWPVDDYCLCSFHSDTLLIMSWIYRQMNHVVEGVQIHAKKLELK